MLSGFLDPVDWVTIVLIAAYLGLTIGKIAVTREVPNGLALIAKGALVLAGSAFLLAALVPAVRTIPGLYFFIEGVGAVGLITLGIVSWIDAPKAAGAGKYQGSLDKGQLVIERCMSVCFLGLGLMAAASLVSPSFA